MWEFLLFCGNQVNWSHGASHPMGKCTHIWVSYTWYSYMNIIYVQNHHIRVCHIRAKYTYMIIYVRVYDNRAESYVSIIYLLQTYDDFWFIYVSPYVCHTYDAHIWSSYTCIIYMIAVTHICDPHIRASYMCNMGNVIRSYVWHTYDPHMCVSYIGHTYDPHIRVSYIGHTYDPCLTWLIWLSHICFTHMSSCLHVHDTHIWSSYRCLKYL